MSNDAATPSGGDDPTDAELGDDLDRAVEEIAAGVADRPRVGRIAKLLARSARRAGRSAVLSGRWLAEVSVRTAPRLPVRDLETLKTQYGGVTGSVLAGELIKSATRSSAAIGAATGAAVSAEAMHPPGWVLIPFEVMVETLVIAAVEMRLIAELHEVYGLSIGGAPPDRGLALVWAWAERRGVPPTVVKDPAQLTRAVGRGTRQQLMRVVRRRLMQRTARNLTSLAPFLVGGVIGAAVNRRATKALGNAVVRDLAGDLSLPARPAG